MRASEQAWVVREYLAGRTQKSIASEIGRNVGSVCFAIKSFCDQLSGVDVMSTQAYGEDRKRAAREAVKKYRGNFDRPSALDWEKQRELRNVRNTAVATMRESGATYRQIGAEFNVTAARAREIVSREERRCKYDREKPWWHNLSNRANYVLRSVVRGSYWRDDMSEGDAARVLSERATFESLIKMDGVGELTIAELNRWLSKFNLKLRNVREEERLAEIEQYDASGWK